MKVQSINNQNNISHKAYFKPNAEFKKLWAVRPKNTEDYFDRLRKFKNDLPNHQLEIVDSGRALIDEKLQDFYLIFNNVTNKAFGVSITVGSVKNHLVKVLNLLLEKNDKTQDFFKSTWDSSEFDNITTKTF